jgi:hypothetical protein
MKVKLILEWIFDQFIYPLWIAIFPPKDSESDDTESSSSRPDA